MVTLVIIEREQRAQYQFGAKDFADAIYKLIDFLRRHECELLEFNFEAI